MSYIIDQIFLFLLIPAGSALVIRSYGFASILIYTILHSSRVIPSLTKWYGIELIFFFKVESSIVVFQRTDWLSPYINTGLLTGIPIILSCYLRLRRYSQQIVIATNLLPNEIVSNDVWFLDSQYIGALFMNTGTPDRDCLVNLSPAWSASTYVCSINSIPSDSGALEGMSSFNTLPYKLLHSCIGNWSKSISGYEVSNTMWALWWYFRYANRCRICCRCPPRPIATSDDIIENSQVISIRKKNQIIVLMMFLP